MPETFEIRIVESYRDYQPPFDVAKLIRKLLRTVPEKYVRGIDCIVLTHLGGLPRRHRVGRVRSRRRKHDKSRILGLYFPKSPTRDPYIELRVDRILSSVTPFTARIEFLRHTLFGQVLFHEIGHHIHFTIRPEHDEKEDVADAWEKRLSRAAIKENYWYLMPLLIPVAKLYGWLRRGE